MEQLLIIEDDIGLNQGLSKALKADDRQIISCQDLKTAKEQLLCGGVSQMCIRDRHYISLPHNISSIGDSSIKVPYPVHASGQGVRVPVFAFL